MHFKPLTSLSILALFCTLVAGDSLSYDTAYDSKPTSIDAVACSDGPNGLGTRGYNTLGSLPHFPNIGGVPAIESWNSPNCGSCWELTFKNTSVYLLGVDKGNGYISSQKAMDTLTGGNAVKFGRINITAERVSASKCGL
jgi:hypothetical protein